MLVLASCLLLTTSALAADYAPQQVAPNNAPSSHSQQPLNYNDDFRAVKPGTNLIFNFEQLRRDQPPQIESRDEDIFRYMYQRPKTTTVPSAPLLSRFNDYAVKMAESSKIQPRARYPEIDTWNHSGTTMPPPPPPPSPKWLDMNYHPWAQHYPTQKSNAGTVYYPSTTSQPQEVSTYDPLPAIQWSDPTKGRDFSEYQVQSAVAPQSVDYSRRQEMPSTTMRPHWTEIAAATELSVRRPVSQLRPRNSHHNTARGNHKFDWTDVAAVEQVQQASTPAPRKNAPPPSIPTLSPWYGDQFGK